MTTASEDTSTLKEIARTRRGRDATPVLLVGSFVPETARVVSLDGPVTIGRGRTADRGARDRDEGVRSGDADVILHSDRTLSRRHLQIARVARSDRRWQVEDLGSANGTLVDGRLAKEPAPLSDGSIVLFGSHAGVFRRVSDAELAAIQQDAIRPFGPVPTLSPVLAVTIAAVKRLAAIDAETHLLFVGETGVGKEVYARAVHKTSKRPGPFVAVNCAAIPSELVESELFGFARGAHSTATRAKQGLVEAAHRGTLLLDEIGDMPPPAQAKLFRFLQERQVTPLGSTRARTIDVRVVAATTKLSETMRSDLIGRFGAEPIVIPPLRERPEDIGALAAHFGGAAFASFDGMEPPAFRALCLYHWPRNVRELEGVVQRAVALAAGRPVRLEDLPEHVRAALAKGPRADDVRRRYRRAPSRVELEELLRDTNGSVAEVARMLDRKWNVVSRWIEQYRLNVDRYRQ
jgi:DNA-binding NtrC family response regulator